MVSKKKPGQKGVRTSLFPLESPETRNPPLAENFFQGNFFSTPLDPLGTLLEGSQMVSKKKPGQKRVRTLLFPPEVPETRNSPLAELFWGEIFLKTPWDPSGTLLGGSQMVSKKKSPKKGPNIDVSTKPQIWGKLPLAGNFLQGNFFSTPWDPSGTLLEGSQMVSRKIPIKKSGLTAVFPYRNP